MTKFKTEATYKLGSEAKGGGLETGYVYFKNVPVVYAKVQPSQLDNKYNSSEREWSLTAFINEEAYEQCDAMPINKGFAIVGKTKKKKGPDRGKLKFDPAVEAYADYEGMYGFNLACPEFTKKKKPRKVRVLDSKGQAFKEQIGNGSICTIKCFAYRNTDDELVITIDTVVVLEHVAYEGGEGSGGYDDELGFEIPPDSEFESPSSDMSEFEEEDDTKPPFETEEDDFED